MFDFGFFSSRKSKEILLKEIIQKLSISETEKEIYILSLEILDDNDFLFLYKKITSQIGNEETLENEKDFGVKTTIAPLTSNLL